MFTDNRERMFDDESTISHSPDPYIVAVVVVEHMPDVGAPASRACTMRVQG